jgi:hypothetical protein
MVANTFSDPQLSNLFWMDIQAVPQPIRAKMYDLERKCNYITPPMSCMNCDTRVVFYVDNVETLHTKDEYKVADAIVSYLVYTEVPDMDAVEIFVGVCPDNGHTINVLIYAVVMHTSYDNVWVGLKPDMSYFKETVRYLVENKFQQAQLTNETYAHEPLDYDVVALVLDKTDSMAHPDEVDRALKLQFKYKSGLKSCMFKVVIPEKVTDALKPYLSKPTELGGNFVIRSYILERTETGDYEPVAYLGFPTNTLVGGESETVSPPYGNFNFHTHPYHCYVKYNCALGWPSHQDMASIPAHRDMGNIMHFVVTIEGIYSIQFTSEFGLYIDSMRKKDYINYDICRYKLYKTIVGFFAPFNNIRAFIERADPHTVLLQYLERVNSVTIKEVIDSAPVSSECNWLVPETDFALYSVKHMSWTEISQEGSFNVYSKNIISMDRPCLPSILEEAGKIGEELI